MSEQNIEKCKFCGAVKNEPSKSDDDRAWNELIELTNNYLEAKLMVQIFLKKEVRLNTFLKILRELIEQPD